MSFSKEYDILNNEEKRGIILRKGNDKMSFIDQIKQRAKKEIKTIVLPEATDLRILKATQIVNTEGYAKIILVGNEEKVRELAKENQIDLGDAKIVDPEKSA